jgi:threonine aldolase
VDSISFCLSKGLGTPVGSIVCGTRDFIHSARRARKLLGGGMRQAGVLAVCGLYALEYNIERLAEDHTKARVLADAIRTIPQLQLSPDTVDSNIIFFHVKSAKFNADQFVARMAEKGVRFSGDEVYHRVRAITHLDVSMEQIHETISHMKAAVNELEA